MLLNASLEIKLHSITFFFFFAIHLANIMFLKSTIFSDGIHLLRGLMKAYDLVVVRGSLTSLPSQGQF